jgi:hypothetical protein
MAERETFEIQGNEEAWEKYRKDGSEDGVTRIPADEVLKAITEGKNIDIQYAIIDGDLDINAIAERLDKDEKGRLIIKGSMVVYHSKINGMASFSGTIFNGIIDFIGATFNDKAYFHEAIFNDKADFIGTTFSGMANFWEATFSGLASFWGTTFNSLASFWETTFCGLANFREATFSNKADFFEATFSDKVYFGRATFCDKADFAAVNMVYPCDFSDVRFRKNTVLKGLWNLGLGRIKRLHWTVTDFSGFNTNIMDSASNPYLKRYIDDELWIKSWFERSRWNEILFFFWELSSHCGRSFGLWACWSILFTSIFAVIYWILGCDEIAFDVSRLIESGKQPSFIGYVYYSIATITALGSGDIVPLTDKARIFVDLEVIIGYVMLGGLISIFANKFARRS